MLSFLFPKTKVDTYGIREIAINSVEMLGVSQINPYCSRRFEDKIFITVVNFSNGFKDFDEKEGLISTNYFAVRKCPKCKQKELIPIYLKINLDSTYLRHEEEIAYDAFEENPSKRHFSSIALAFCKHCSTSFEMKIKTKDKWIKEAKKIKNRELINFVWNEYCLE